MRAALTAGAAVSFLALLLAAPSLLSHAARADDVRDGIIRNHKLGDFPDAQGGGASNSPGRGHGGHGGGGHDHGHGRGRHGHRQDSRYYILPGSGYGGYYSYPGLYYEFGYPGYYGYYGYGPVYRPWEWDYGPLPTMRMMAVQRAMLGVGTADALERERLELEKAILLRELAKRDAADRRAAGAGGADAGDAPEPDLRLGVDAADERAAPREVFRPRASSIAARERALRLVMAGDAHWAEQQYQLALQQYKTAAGAARDLATPYLRQGMALIATRRYDLAADAFVRALDVDDAVPDSDFRLDTLYGDLRLAKNSHLESLAGRALENPDDARLLFVLGVFLHFDGEPERALKFFRKSAELSGGMAPYARLFLRAALVDEPVEGEAAGLGI